MARQPPLQRGTEVEENVDAVGAAQREMGGRGRQGEGGAARGVGGDDDRGRERRVQLGGTPGAAAPSEVVVCAVSTSMPAMRPTASATVSVPKRQRGS